MIMEGRTPEVLLVEDNPGDIRLTVEAMHESAIDIHLNVAEDGVAALDFLHQRSPYEHMPRPDLILLDLNLPRKDGREVLAEIKSDSSFRQIPVIVLSTSSSEEDVAKCYDLHANCYITKPLDFSDFIAVFANVKHFWLKLVLLPERV